MTQDPLPQNTPDKTSNAPVITHQNKKLRSKKTRTWASHIPWYCDAFNPVLGECGLWMAVITQALMDALSRSRNPELISHKNAAIEWLTGNSKDFRFVCMLAGMNHSDVRRRAKKAIVAPTAWRAEAGKGSRYEERKAYRTRVKKCSPPPTGGRPGGGHCEERSQQSPHPNPPPMGEGKIIVGPWQ